jgi:hypothetical protein
LSWKREFIHLKNDTVCSIRISLLLDVKNNYADGLYEFLNKLPHVRQSTEKRVKIIDYKLKVTDKEDGSLANGKITSAQYVLTIEGVIVINIEYLTGKQSLAKPMSNKISKHCLQYSTFLILLFIISFSFIFDTTTFYVIQLLTNNQ